MKATTFVEVSVGNKLMRIETGLLAQQAQGAVTVQSGETILFSAVTAADAPRAGIDYFPLQVEYREKYYAAGKFPGGFFKREARPSEKEVLTARLTDRPIRALFQKGFRNEVQINNMLLSADGETDADILSIVASSAALTISDLPFYGPIAGVRVGRVDGTWVLNPTHSERSRSDLDLIYACTRDLPIMIEGDAREISETDLLAAMKAAHAACVAIIDAQLALRRKLGLPPKAVVDLVEDQALITAARGLAGTELAEVLCIEGKQERRTRMNTIRETLKTKLAAQFPEMTDEQFRALFDELEIETVRANVLKHDRRIGGRAFDAIRPLTADVGLLPRAHGSALFSRGETQALGTVTLGSKGDIQKLDAITGGPVEKKFMLHYNFPPYCVGEVGRLGSTGRREQGHGALAERSLEVVMPQDFPYTVRLVSDIMGSNGSSSMASVCVGALALMDAGVPIRQPVAGISIGLFTGGDRAVLVTDIIGEEDHCGDMDFKVAGTRQGITGFQVDLKIRGLDWALVAQAFEKARVARLQILDFMATILEQPRKEMSPYAPRVSVVKINPEKIGALIGPGGKNIRRITDMTDTQIDIEDDGTVSIFSTNQASMDMALREVSLVSAEAEEGVIYNGTVTGIKEFGAFVEIFPGRDGLVHISELADFRVNHVEDICKLGDQMWVKCIGVDERGKIRLSRRAAMQEKGLTDKK
ncbi:MAG: polyribonucleotide nucleotidyltransferase [Kiritimatiellaeota bacterium]|nr:polyribonucleotide nucleotidyltransferase [Kiritimatiellota bacterium]